jgi:hypothetical protein
MKSSSKLSDFIKSQVTKEKESNIDWESKKNFWIEKVNDLYQQIEGYLSESKAEGLVSTSRSSCTINEQYIGAYKVDSLFIKIGKNEIQLLPVGTLIIAGRGRVDIKGPKGSAMLILFGKGERPTIKITISEGGKAPEAVKEPRIEPKDYEWVVIKKRGQKEYPVLNEDTFLDTIKVVTGHVES